MTVVRGQGSARFRLRFLLHEIDLQGPEVLVGRSQDCQITIEDPLISREHIRLRVADDAVLLTDLSSRNGVLVNGEPVVGEATLRDGDRVRLGTQELVLVRVSPSDHRRATGCIIVCHACDIPYPEEAAHCPHCGAREAMGLPTDAPKKGKGAAGQPGSSDRETPTTNEAWALQLILDGVTHALTANRLSDVQRMVNRLGAHLERELDFDPPTVEQVSHVVLTALEMDVGPNATDVDPVELLNLKQDWLDYMLQMYRRAKVLPGELVLDRLERVGSRLPSIGESIARFVNEWEQQAFALRAGDGERWARLCRLANARPTEPVAT